MVASPSTGKDRGRNVFVRIFAVGIVAAGTLAAPQAAIARGEANLKLSTQSGGEAGSSWSEELDPELLALMRHQEALNPAVDILTKAAFALPGAGGYTSVAFEGDGVALYWKGEMPPSMADAVEAARKIGSVQVRSADFSRAELEAEAAKLERASSKPSDIQSIEWRSDGSGLVVEKMPEATAAAVRAKAGKGLSTAEEAIAKSGLRVPVSITTPLTSMTFQSCSGPCHRTDDESWWNSGGEVKMKHNTSDVGYYGSCTSGFAVTVPAWGGETYLLTAAHCASWHAGSGDWFYDGAGELIGRADIDEDWDKDLLIIDARGWYWMWDGDTTTANHKTVHSYGNAVAWESVCNSGKTTGTRCWLQTQPNFIYFYTITDSDGDTFDVHDLVRTCKTQGSEPASQQGDSGAPVFTLDGDGVKAKGVHSGGDGTCTLFQDMETITTDRTGSWVHAIPYTG